MTVDGFRWTIAGRILVIDSHPLFRQALRAIIREAHPQLMVSEAGDIAEAREILKHESDIILVTLDVRSSDYDNLSSLLELKASFPDIPVAIISSSDDLASASSFMALGAAVCISKSMSPTEIVRAINRILAGEVWAPISLCPEAVPAQIKSLASLSPAQLRILIGLRQGLRNKQIAFEMNVSERTVKAYMTTMFRKLGVNSRTQVVIATQSALAKTVRDDRAATSQLHGARRQDLKRYTDSAATVKW